MPDDDEDRKKSCTEHHNMPGWRDVTKPIQLQAAQLCVHILTPERPGSAATSSRPGGGAGNSRAFVDGWEQTFGRGSGGMVN